MIAVIIILFLIILLFLYAACKRSGELSRLEERMEEIDDDKDYRE